MGLFGKSSRKFSDRPTPADFKRVHVFFSGIVQGVGFRYTSRMLAFQLKLTGWVKNLWDGRVEIVAEGPETNLKKLINDLRNDYFRRYIKNVDTEWSEPTGEFDSFKVKF